MDLGRISSGGLILHRADVEFDGIGLLRMLSRLRQRRYGNGLRARQAVQDFLDLSVALADLGLIEVTKCQALA